MKYIKMYESWLNEAAPVKLDAILSGGLEKNKQITNSILIELSNYGKVFESQIRKNIISLRGKYTPSSLWNNLNSKEGINMAMKNFKDLFFMSYGGRGYSNSPLNGFTVKVNNALNLSDGDFFNDIKIDNELWRSKEAVELKNIIVNGDEELAKGLASSIILSDLATAITNGMYYMSSSVTLKKWKDQENVNLGALLNSTLTGKFTNYDTLVGLGKESRMFTSLKDVYTSTYNPRIPREWKGFEVEHNYDQFIPYVKGMSFDYVVSTIEGGGFGPNQPPSEFFAPLFVGSYMTTDANYSMDKAVEFMKSGGPNLLQSAISKIG